MRYFYCCLHNLNTEIAPVSKFPYNGEWLAVCDYMYRYNDARQKVFTISVFLAMHMVQNNRNCTIVHVAMKAIFLFDEFKTLCLDDITVKNWS